MALSNNRLERLSSLIKVAAGVSRLKKWIVDVLPLYHGSIIFLKKKKKKAAVMSILMWLKGSDFSLQGCCDNK